MTLLFDGSDDGCTTVLLAHGAGAPMDSPSMQAVTLALADVGFRVARFEFSYMAARRSGGRAPPPKAEKLIPEYREAVRSLPSGTRLIIGGKSMGGRVASMVADELYVAGQIIGHLCLGYPFHPPNKPQQKRTAHLAQLRTPTIIAQGTHDPFGTPDEVAAYFLSPAIEILWLEDGDHDLKPRKSVSGFTQSDHLGALATHVRAWAETLT
jgi:predicted alpha/beta-hydrolase family hydrolase